MVQKLHQVTLAHDLEEADDEFFAHEDIGYKFFEETIEGDLSLNKLIDDLWPAKTGHPPLSSRIQSILQNSHITASIRDRILHTIVDGPIDADKLDYLVRDSLKLKVPYGLMIDFERLSKVMTIIHKIEGEYLWAAVGVHEKGKVSAESVAFARYAMFGAVYWHRTSRAVKAMLHHAAWDMLSQVREENRRQLKEQFEQLILKNRLPSIQQELFVTTTEQRMKQALWPGINLADLQLLSWLWQMCGVMGRHLIELLAVQKLYKRVLVVSELKNKDIWNKAYKFAAKASPLDRLALDQALQDALLSHLGSLSKHDRETTEALKDSAIHGVGEIGQEFPLVLVDIPPDRTEGMHDLNFFGESDRWKYYEDDLVQIRVEDSQVWASIAENFVSSLGKIRVFVHPTIRETVRSIEPAKLEELLTTALITYPRVREKITAQRQM